MTSYNLRDKHYKTRDKQRYLRDKLYKTEDKLPILRDKQIELWKNKSIRVIWRQIWNWDYNTLFIEYDLIFLTS